MLNPDSTDELDDDNELDRRIGMDEFHDHGPYFGI